MDEIDHFLANLQFIGDNDFLFAVPLGTPSELRARMFAAWKSYGHGLLSMDEVWRNIGKCGISIKMIAPTYSDS